MWHRRERRQDQRFALLACILANANGGDDGEPFEIRDFLPMNDDEREALEKEKVKKSQQRLAAHLRARPGR